VRFGIHGALVCVVFAACTSAPVVDSAITLASVESTSSAPDVVSSSTSPATTAASTAPSISPTTTAHVVTVDESLRRCPTAPQVGSVLSRVHVVFESDATAPTLVCTAAEGSADLTRLQERMVQALLIMDRVEFDEPLPWTDLELFDWFARSIDGIRVEDVEYSSCCDATGYMSVKSSGLAAVDTERWIDPSNGAGLSDLVGLLVHEARHNEDKPHTCDGGNDATVAEMGAWAVQAFLFQWFAQHLDQSFFATTDPWPGYYTEQMLFAAEQTLSGRICEQ
jgi:hypothetical protein